MGAASTILCPTIADTCVALERFLSSLEHLNLRPELKSLLVPIISAIKSEGSTAIFSDEKRLLLLLKVYVDHQKLTELPAIDDDELMPLELSSPDFIQVAVTSLKSAQGKVRDYSIVAENAGIEDLSCLLNLLGTECPPPLLLRDLNVTGNNIVTFAPDTFALHSCIEKMHLGGNPFKNFSPLAAILPSTLVALDLSFTEGLVLEKGCFVLCPQLLQLCLDGCELNSTTHDVIQGDDQQLATRSIFYGLVQLNLLSLKENNLENAASLEGLQYFAFSTYLGEEMSRFMPQSLEYLHVEDNPVSDSQSSLRAAKSALIGTIHSLKYINNETTTRHAVSSFDVIGSATRRKRDDLDAPSDAGSSLFSGNEKGLDAMEKEYLSALKGERDVSVVS